jgi:hypothetical protein
LRKTFLFLFAAALVFVGFGRADAKKLMELKIGKGEAKVSRLDGSARILPSGKKIWHFLRANDILRSGDEVRTGPRARLELIMADYAVVRFADRSHFKILLMETANETTARNVNIRIAAGRSWANLSRAIGMGQFEMACDNAATDVKGTIFHMSVEEDASALIRVYDGQVGVSGGGKDGEKRPVFGPPMRNSGLKPISSPSKLSTEEWKVTIKAMQQIHIGADGTAGKPRDFAEQEDRNEWVSWNKSQDQELKAMTE